MTNLLDDFGFDKGHVAMSKTIRLGLIAALMLPVMASCSGAPARAEAQQHDSPPPKPMPAPQVVAKTATDPVFNASTIATLFPVSTQDLLVMARNKARKQWRKDAKVVPTSARDIRDTDQPRGNTTVTFRLLASNPLDRVPRRVQHPVSLARPTCHAWLTDQVV